MKRSLSMERRMLILVAIICCLAEAQDDPRRVLARQRAEGIDLSPDWRGVVVDWTALDEDGNSTIDIPFDKPFRVVKLSKFEQTAEEVEEIAGEHGRLELVCGTPCFLPHDISNSNLSVPVTLNLRNVSTWDAIKAVIKQVNCSRRFGDSTEFCLRMAGALKIPTEFDGERCVSVSLDDVPARRALCDILSQAPLDVGVHSRNVHRGDWSVAARKYWEVIVDFYRGNQPLVATEFDSRERSKFWGREDEDVEVPAEACIEED